MARKTKNSNMEYWACHIGPVSRAELDEVALHKQINGTDMPLRTAVCDAFARLMGKPAVECCSGWGVDKQQVSSLSFASWDDATKRGVVISYLEHKTKMPRYVRAWYLLLKEEGKL